MKHSNFNMHVPFAIKSKRLFDPAGNFQTSNEHAIWRQLEHSVSPELTHRPTLHLSRDTGMFSSNNVRTYNRI